MEGDWIYEEQEDGSCSQEDIQICGLDGCPFRGPKSVLEDHILYLHATGVYNRLNRGNNDPKEIAAWREQRKKYAKYPTHSITESARLKSQSRKTQYELVNKARSEAFESFLLERTRLNEEKAKSRHNRTRDRQQQQKKQKRKKRVNGSGKENFMDDEEDPPGMNGSLHSFPGTAALTNSVQNESDEEEMDQKEMVGFHISDDEEDAMFRNKPIEPTDEVESETDSYDGPPEEICIVRGEKEDNFMSDEILHKHSNNIERLIPNDNDLKNMARLQNYENRENPLNDEHSENIVECKPKNIDHLKDIERTSKNEALKNIYHTEDNEDKIEERKPNQHLNNTEHLKNDESSKNVEQCKPTTESPKKDLHIENIEHLPHFECSQNVGEDTENVQHPQTIEHTEDVQHSKIIEYTENVKNPKNRHNENSNDERIAQSSQHPNNVKQIKNYPKYPNNNEQLETIERHKSVDNPNEHPPNHELPDKDTDVISSHMEDTHPTTSNDDNSQNEGKSLPKSEETSSTSPHKTTSKRQTDSNDDCPALKKLKTSKEENYTKSPYVIEPPQKSSIKLVRQSKEPISFLQILLSDEIKAEKKVLLQSVKYICDNNFFRDT